MRDRIDGPALAAIALLVLTSLALAAPQGPGRFADAEHRYDPATVETLTGTVQEVLLRTGRAGAAGLHLLLTAGDEELEVIVGPTFWVYPQGLEVEAGDEITVTGSRLSIDGGAMLMAREIRAGDLTLALRDESGVPAWRGEGPESMADGDDAAPGAGRAGRACGRQAEGGCCRHGGHHGAREGRTGSRGKDCGCRGNGSQR